MIVTLRTERIRTLDEVRAFLEGSEPVDFTLDDRDSAYVFVRRSLERLRYHRLGKPDKGLVKAYLAKVTGLSRAQLTRLIAQHKRTGHIRDRRHKPPAKPFKRRYTPRDSALLAEVDTAYGQPSGPATKEVLRRQYEVHGDVRFKRLVGISNSHIYNLRKARAYRLGSLSLNKTRPVHIPIGVRRKPDPQGRPGFVRVDTVHQGDKDGEKGLYVVNVVDQVTQFEHIGAVSRITELFMLPVLEDLLTAFPFPVEGFHADNGSEYVNHHVAGMLNKLHIGEFTKSRPRHSNDNALVESKNGAIVRKWLGRAHIPQDCAPAVNDFLRDHLCPFLNFHRPRLFASETTGPRGRTRKRYLQSDVATPYDKLKSLPGAEGFLKPGLTFEQLDRSVRATSGLDAAKTMRQARRHLFRTLGPAISSVA
ncbi:integrase [Candidatus Palauibacter sp.]|uniref:integrase n=1 Tax=Candidatus Palauibacter sp. TaxID=3101350 RepID=UPI003C6FEFEA